MWFLQQKVKLADTGFFKGFTDYHCHILPGVDDGVKTMEESLEALAYFESLEVKKVVLTPHVMNEVNQWEKVVQTFDALDKRYSGSIILELGAEYMIDSGFNERMERGLQPLCRDEVLVETSYFSPPRNLDEQLYRMSLNGYTPVIAHPERYLYMTNADYYKLKEKDFMLQLNLLSLAGFYGKRVMKNAELLLAKGMYDRVGTDLHSLDTFGKWLGSVKLDRNLLEKIMNIC